MHRKHLLPGFEDKSSDEAAIEALTMEITNVHFIKHINTVKLIRKLGILSYKTTNTTYKSRKKCVGSRRYHNKKYSN